MPRRRVNHTQADYERMLRAAKKQGASAVKLTLASGDVVEFALGDNGEKVKAKVAKKPVALI